MGNFRVCKISSISLCEKKNFFSNFPGGGGGGKVQEDSNGLLVNLFWDKSVALDVTGKLPMRL